MEYMLQFKLWVKKILLDFYESVFMIFMFLCFYEQIEYKYLFFMAWLSAQLLKMIEKQEQNTVDVNI